MFVTGYMRTLAIQRIQITSKLSSLAFHPSLILNILRFWNNRKFHLFRCCIYQTVDITADRLIIGKSPSQQISLKLLYTQFCNNVIFSDLESYYIVFVLYGGFRSYIHICVCVIPRYIVHTLLLLNCQGCQLDNVWNDTGAALDAPVETHSHHHNPYIRIVSWDTASWCILCATYLRTLRNCEISYMSKHTNMLSAMSLCVLADMT